MLLTNEEVARFWNKVDVRSPAECWEWRAAKNSAGYGNFYARAVGLVTAHRVAAYLHGMGNSLKAPTNRKGAGFICHQCDNRACCNPAHMAIGTYSRNMFEAYSRGRKKQPKGSGHANSPLRPGDAKRIRELYATGEYRQADLGIMFGITQPSVGFIIRGESYKNEGGPIKCS